MPITYEQYLKEIDEHLTRQTNIAFKCFTGPEHEYQAAIQNYEYRNERKEYITICERVADNLAELKDLIIRDYKQWRK